jgi:hypothetical protein
MKRATWAGRGDLAASLVLIAPLVFAYEIGVLFAGRVNGADIVTRAVYAAVGSRAAYLLLYAAIAVGFLIWIRHTRRWGTLRADVALPVILEAAIYALTLGSVVTAIVHHLLGLTLDASNVVGAFGAGVHEELVFRLALCAGGAALLARAMPGRAALAIAVVGSSLAFAAAHHLGDRGEAWSVHAFAFRSLAGIAFALVFWFRSLAHAVYAHVLYDLVVAAS